MKTKKAATRLCLPVLLVFLITSTAFAGASGAGAQAMPSISKAIGFLHRIQNPDGGFPSKPGGPSNPAVTSWVILALKAAQEDVTSPSWAPSGKSPVDYLKTCEYPLQQTCDYARLLLALSASQQGTKYRGIDLVEKITSFQQPGGEFLQPAQGEKGMINAHMWSCLALASAGKKVPNSQKAREWLLARQNEDGGFGWLEGGLSDTDDTGVALQTLVLLGEDPKTSPAIKKALNYLQGCREQDGGFNSGDAWKITGANAASDAWVLQGLIAVGENPQSTKWSMNGRNAISHLVSLQNSDGSFNWKAGTPSSLVTMTAYAIMALAGKPFPLQADGGIQFPASVPTRFCDLPSEHWAYEPIMKLVQAKALSGYPDGSFRPQNPVTRAEFAVFLVRGLGWEENSGSTSSPGFADVSPNHWAYRAISTVASKGYVKGKPGGVFDANGKITGAEVASILVRALPSCQTTALAKGPYWYSGYVQLAQENALLYPGFRADQRATRAQCAYSLERLRQLLRLEQ
ncbi:MAG: hypothetical protein GXX09_01975 [Syntrophomonadaceae bacterium]|nr:hypothetical protein [Syntrophomonadaceae bacterium]